MATTSKKISAIFLVFTFGVIIVVSAWDYFSGKNERWIHYQDTEAFEILGEYESHEECSQGMKVVKNPSDCRRVDGPYGIINAITDKVL